MKPNLIIRTHVIAAALRITAECYAQNGTLDAAFQAEVNAAVRAIAVQADGRILIAGDFTSVNGFPQNRLARLHADGELDRSFNIGAGPGGQVFAIALQTDAKIIVGGYFPTFDNRQRGGIARLNPDGALDTTFNVGTGTDNAVYAVTIQADGRVVIGGGFGTVNSSNRSHIARLNSNGSVDTNFDTSMIDGNVRCLALQPDGRIMVGGSFNNIGGTPRGGIARLRTDGDLDVTFYPGAGTAPAEILTMMLRGTAGIVIGGNFYFYNGTRRYGIAQLSYDGSLDHSFAVGPGICCPGVSAAALTDSRIVIVGGFSSVHGVSRTGAARLNADGSLDSTFSPGLDPAGVNTIGVQPDGKILIGGDFIRVNGITRVRIARLNADVPSPAAFLGLKLYAGLTLSGQTGFTYRVEYTSNLTNQTLWQTLTDVTLSNAPLLYIDTSSPFSPRRFYRAVTLP